MPLADDCNRAGLWKAIAGMAVAIALASAIVSIDISRQLIHRTQCMGHRIAVLRQKIAKLEHEADVSRVRLTVVRKQLSHRGLILRVLVAPDVVSVKLAKAVPDATMAATLSLSRKMSGAVLNATGLEKLAPGQAYQTWWISKNASAIRVAEFVPQADGSATVYLDPPPRMAEGLQCVVTRGSSGQDPTQVMGSILLRARLSR